MVEFENLIMKGDLQESEEQAIAYYLIGLEFEMARVTYLQPYHTL